MNLFDLSGRLALVTGASKGIGYAVAEALASAGARIVLNARDETRLEQARAELAAKGYDVRTAAFDVTDPDAVTAGIEAIETEIGPIDILVNNAGMQHRTPLQDFPLEAWRKIVATNIDSVYLVGQAVGRRMIPRGRGKIINIGSVQSEMARPGIAPYTATKGAVKMLTKGMATDWARYGIQVNGIGPGYFKTELNAALVADEAFSGWLANRTPAGRWGDVQELAGAAIFLASDASSFVNGHILYVDGGITASL
ncbi:SDR family oxidoreductase [Kaistia defluvii]|uniref:SDR family oxidoreductase n=1 Tax=Kaistia defluvii TaxID=410841 RepID=UPI002256F698|nr:SDR family oxidoreductase [Kaistia defluvii]MCX5517251.1 SDR family oxidoreductase [Kaistia defluvii]